MIWLVATSGLWAAGCTTLGPMPATTGISAVPSGRPGVEAQVGLLPGYFLSEATQQPKSSQKGDPTGQVMALVEPDRLIEAPGLIIGARHWGDHGEVSIEPFIGYRHRLDGDISLALIGYGTTMNGASRGASYSASRAGGELALDARVIAPARWLALHGQAAISATYLSADGTYCADSAGFGVDCDEDGTDRVVNGSLRGVFPAATASLALDFGRMPTSAFHSFRVALLGSVGVMPQLRDGVSTDGVRYVSLGLTLTLGLGASQ